MARRRTPHLWLLVALFATGVGLHAAAVADHPESHPAAPQLAVALTGDSIEATVVGTGGQVSSGRLLLPLVAALMAVGGGGGLIRRRSVLTVAGEQPLLARRYAIALRAPPSFPLA